jgi:hypothetical protein
MAGDEEGTFGEWYIDRGCSFRKQARFHESIAWSRFSINA